MACDCQSILLLHSVLYCCSHEMKLTCAAKHLFSVSRRSISRILVQCSLFFLSCFSRDCPLQRWSILLLFHLLKGTPQQLFLSRSPLHKGTNAHHQIILTKQFSLQTVKSHPNVYFACHSFYSIFIGRK